MFKEIIDNNIKTNYLVSKKGKLLIARLKNL